MKKTLWMIFVIIAAGFAVFWYFNRLGTKLNLFQTIYSIFSIEAISLFLSVIIHELGHLIMGKLNNFSFLGFQILGFTIKLENGKLKFSNDGYNNAVGMAIMIPNDEATDKNNLYYYAGGIIANTITLLPVTLLLIFHKEARLMWIISFITILFLIITNSVPKDINGLYNDGYLIKLFLASKDDENSEIMINIRILNKLTAGKRPRELEYVKVKDTKNIYSIMNSLFMFYRALDLGDVGQMRENIEIAERNYEILENIQKTAVEYELVFYYLVVEKNREKAAWYYSKIEAQLEKDLDINGRRVLAYYYKYALLDDNRANIVAKQGLSVKDKYPIRGIALMEEELLEKIYEKIKN